ncbi:hypothetical protein [Peribacillus frigoritolerans]|uniref:Uncharacterized protein n=1 Tax=Peribacillus castrilensis TaxID=2897690 RepID=A0AAW9N0C9_9BACI|nr:hypothetical protein [Peribacillus castrilensis]
MLMYLGLISVVIAIFFIIAAVISAFRKTRKVKKMLLLALGSFIFLFVFAFIDALTDEETEVETNSTPTNKTTQTEENQEEDLEETWFPATESSREEEIEETVNSIIDKNYSHTTVNEMEVNENLGLNDGSYIVLPYLKWDAMNNAKRTKNLIEMYSDDLAANLAEEDDISELTIFWEVPYHLEGKNVAKFTYTKNGDSMSIGERWYDPSLR